MAFQPISYLIISALLYTQTVGAVKVFTFDCKAAADVCDTHCFARDCVGFHRDLFASSRMPKNGSRSTSADFRRQAIGCVNNNPCSGGASCDEIPYASTYDGGLGCFPEGFPGNSNDLFEQGVIHCVSGNDNSAHGALLNNFYKNNNIKDGELFHVALKNDDSAPLCEVLRELGGHACPEQGNRGPPRQKYYLGRSAPDNSYCPGRTRRSMVSTKSGGLNRRERTVPPARLAITDNGMRIREAIGNLNEGDEVWSMSEDGTDRISTIIGFE
ncbi:hypothetical protein BDZ94DRAFT_1241509 [Collybia nuda]|uniref:Deoxyribonuclease NucA/NucB domain-containing protein n=1 Tax=Collybia nuda TaxID=64659 RepID=A0A9P6C8P4_9AGAR|nr:hypothetical protein BDZ94DRAFT_1241509 [Collybia nuda]